MIILFMSPTCSFDTSPYMKKSQTWFSLQLAALKGEAPPGLPLKGAGQDSSDAQPKVETLSDVVPLLNRTYNYTCMIISLKTGHKWWSSQC